MRGLLAFLLSVRLSQDSTCLTAMTVMRMNMRSLQGALSSRERYRLVGSVPRDACGENAHAGGPMSGSVRLSFGACLGAVFMAMLPTSVFADGSLSVTEALSPSADSNLIAQYKPTPIQGQSGLAGGALQPTPFQGQSGLAGGALQLTPVTGLPVMLAQESNLYGAWNADIAGMLAAEAANMAPEELAMMQALMGSMEITFTFNVDGTAAMAMNGMGQSEVKGGTWRVLSVDGSAVRFELIETPTLGTTSTPEWFIATFQSTNNMTLTKDGDPQVIPFYRR